MLTLVVCIIILFYFVFNPDPDSDRRASDGEGRGKGIAGRSDVVECYVVTISKHFNWPIYRFNYVFMRNIESVIRKNTHRATSRSRRGRQQQRERESKRDREGETDLWLIAVRATQQILTILESPVDERRGERETAKTGGGRHKPRAT